MGALRKGGVVCLTSSRKCSSIIEGLRKVSTNRRTLSVIFLFPQGNSGLVPKFFFSLCASCVALCTLNPKFWVGSKILLSAVCFLCNALYYKSQILGCSQILLSAVCFLCNALYYKSKIQYWSSSPNVMNISL
jgi:hypothetical protein